ncbi:MAG: aspartate kinase [Planctomycetia bacterium]|nr:aspartate kinase [Planctomycetia bacterium]
MALIVQKFGGTSVADTKRISAAARRAIREAHNGNQVVMVVSAMGKQTDHLISLAKELCDRPNTREMDMLMSTGEQVTIALMAIALESLGHKAVSFTGAQIGIRTDATYSKARIRSISTDRMRKALDEGKIVIAAGFQGVDDDFNITTLGRGGSDTTAVALAAALKADRCDIYTDVDGVYTTDPRIVPEARRLERISYDEMLELASLGAGVMHSRSIEFAKKFGTIVHVRSSFSDNPGTIIGPDVERVDAPVCGAALAKDETRITVIGVPDEPGVAMRLFSKFADAKIPTDMIAQNSSAKGRTDVSFTVQSDDALRARDVVAEAVKEINAERFEIDENVAKVSVVGLGMTKQAGVAQKMFHALSECGVNIQMIATSDIKISALVGRDDAVTALRAAHRAFKLDVELTEEERSKSAGSVQIPSDSFEKGVSTHLISHLTGMEDVVVEGVELDDDQVRVTLYDLPDRPGLAAEVFDKVAEGRIIVDMIVQSVGRDSLANITFTVPREELESVTAVTKQVCASYECHSEIDSRVAKLSVRGSGLRSHTGLAYRMFKTLSDCNVNVSVISLSERCVGVLVDKDHGAIGRENLQREFANETF